MPAPQKPDETDWTQIDRLYGAIEVMQHRGGDAQPRVAVSKVRGPEAALQMMSRWRRGYEFLSFFRRARSIHDGSSAE